MTFLQSKDDSLLLQIGALIMSIIMATEDDPKLREEIGSIFSQPTQEHSEMPFPRIKNQADLIDVCVDVLSVVPPFRSFTQRLFSRIIQVLKPDYKLTPAQ